MTLSFLLFPFIFLYFCPVLSCPIMPFIELCPPYTTITYSSHTNDPSIWYTVGVGGSGKQSLCRLAAFISGFSVVQIVISSTYGVSDLKEDLKSMYVTAGMKEEGVVLLLTDSQITDERFLIYINDLLASGNIPDLYTPEEVSASYIDHSFTRT